MSRTVVSLALGVTGVLLLAAGCASVDFGPDAPAPTSTLATPSPASTPAQDELEAALRRTQSGPYTFEVRSDLPESGSVSASGAFDPVKKLFKATTTITGGKSPGTLQRIVVGSDSYQRPSSDKPWIHLDLSRVKKDNILVYFDMTDPTGLAKFTSTIADVERTGPHSYQGYFNPFSSLPEFLPIGAPSLVNIGGGNAPFTATTDDKDRVSEIRIVLSPSNAAKLTMTTTLHGQDKPLTIRAPAKASVREADPMYYH